jgi:CDP-diacylglycerol--serine O-phosphatidyltransferase
MTPEADFPAETDTTKPRPGLYVLPNLLTTGTLFAGFYAIVAAIDGNFSRAGVAVFVAMIFDGLDGRVARWTNTQSTFGKEYDSLSDMVAFGVAPAIVAYQWDVARIEQIAPMLPFHFPWGRIAWLATFFYAVGAALRLARFNAKAAVADKRYFEGLPSPSAAAAMAGLIWLASDLEWTDLTALIISILASVVVGALMVSRFSYWSGKTLNLRGRVPWAYAVLVPLVYIAVSAGPITLLALFGTYALSAPLFWCWRRLRRRPHREAHPAA